MPRHPDTREDKIEKAVARAKKMRRDGRQELANHIQEIAMLANEHVAVSSLIAAKIMANPEASIPMQLKAAEQCLKSARLLKEMVDVCAKLGVHAPEPEAPPPKALPPEFGQAENEA